MNTGNSFTLSLDFDGRHYDGTITPSEQKGANGMPIFFRVVLNDVFFAYLCCGENGWLERDGDGKPKDLVNAIGNYIMEYYE